MRHRPALVALFLALPAAASPVFGADRQGFSLSVVVDGCEAPEYEHAGRLYVEALRGRNFSLRVSNPTSERIAVALSVDGRNVVDAKRTSAFDATKWILSSGQSIDIPGWQISGETARKFFFTETGRSYAKWLGDTANVGTIEAVFFREKRHRPLPIRGTVEEESMRRGQRTPDAPSISAEAPPTTESVVVSGEAPLLDSRKTTEDRFAATGIGERTGFPVTWVDFEEDPTPAARIALRYEFRRELISLGVLPRPADGLAARERAYGFEPRYAPDPDRPR